VGDYNFFKQHLGWKLIFVGASPSGEDCLFYHNRNGRFRAIYQFPVSSSSSTLTGNIHVDVHYYEDGNVALNATKPINISIPSVSAESIVSRVAAAERDYQETLNRAFVQTSEGVFKGLRRQLPITRQKVEWEKVGGYRLGQDISGGKGR
jgi:capping protein alpha